MASSKRARSRELGILVGDLECGPNNAITDVPGVREGHTTLIEGDGQRVVGKGPIRTGVTVVVPHGGDIFAQPVIAGVEVWMPDLRRASG